MLISIRMNAEEQAELESLKDYMGLKGVFGEDSTTIKMSLTFTNNVLRSLFGEKLSNLWKRRVRMEQALMKLKADHKRHKSNTKNAFGVPQKDVPGADL